MTETFLDEQNVYWVLWLNTLLHELGVPVPMTPTALVAGARAVTVSQSVIADCDDHRRDGDRKCGVVCCGPPLRFRRVEAVVSRFDLARYLRRSHRRDVRTLGLVRARDRTLFTRCDVGRATARGRAWNGWSTFILLTVAGSALFGLVVVGAGMLLPEQIDFVLQQLSIFGWEAVGILTRLLALYIGWRWWRRRIALAIGVPRIDVQELRALIDAGNRSS